MKLGKWVVGFAVVATAGGLLWDKYFHVSVKPATESEIRAAIPASLLPSGHDDPLAQSRFTSLISVCKQLKLTNQMGADFERENLASLPANGQLAASAMGFIHQGPIEAPMPQLIDFPMWTNLKLLSKVLAFQAKVEGKAGESAACEESIQNGLDLASADRSCGGDLIGYLVYIGIDAIAVEAAADCIRSGWLKPAELRKLIGAIKQYGLDDTELKSDYRQELRYELFDKTTGLVAMPGERQEPQPAYFHAVPPLESNLDVLETAKDLSKVHAEWIDNAGRPWAAQEAFEEKRLDALAKSLPEDPSPPDGMPTDTPDEGEKKVSWLQGLRYKMAMNAIPNSSGITLVALSSAGGADCRPISIERSCARRLLQGLAAIWAYKEEHGGKYPGSLDELVSAGYLEQVPVDWFSQRPLLYNAQTHVIYSVGRNMKDDGGDVKHDGRAGAPDFGFADQPRSAQP